MIGQKILTQDISSYLIFMIGEILVEVENLPAIWSQLKNRYLVYKNDSF